MALALKDTLGELRDELATRLGFGAQIGNLGSLDLTLKSFLKDAQDVLWQLVDVPELKRDAVRKLGIGQLFYDYPDDCSPTRIFKVCVQVGVTWRRLREEEVPFTEAVDAAALPAGEWVGSFPTLKSRSAQPSAFERREQLWIHPAPTEAQVVRITYQKILNPFSQDGHRATLDPRIVFRLALANGKSHYKQPDAKRYDDAAEATLRRLRASEHGGQRYSLLHGDVSGSPRRGGDWYRDRYSRPVTKEQITP